MDRLIGTLVVLLAVAVALPVIAAAAHALIPVLIALLVGSVAIRWIA